RVWAGGREFSVTGGGYNNDGEFLDAATEEPVAPGPGRDPLRMTLLIGALSNEADAGFLNGADPVGDPTELALHAAAAKGGLEVESILLADAQLDIVPFESERRFMATLNDGPDGRAIHLKGAPEVVLAVCDRQLMMAGEEAPIDHPEIRAAAAALAARGLRVLAMAYRDHDGDRIPDAELRGGFVFAGLQGMRDPIRTEAADAVRSAHEAGIRVMMLTGDHVQTAAAVGADLGLDADRAGAVEAAALNAL